MFNNIFKKEPSETAKKESVEDRLRRLTGEDTNTKDTDSQKTEQENSTYDKNKKIGKRTGAFKARDLYSDTIDHGEDGKIENVTESVLIHNAVKNSILLSVVLAITLIVSSVALFFIINREVPNEYTEITDDGKLIIEKPFNMADKTDTAIIDFSIEAVKRTNSYDYINYRDQLSEAKKYFTNDGYDQFMTQFSYSSIKDTLIAKKAITKLTLDLSGGRKISILHKGVIKNVFTWRVSIPAIIEYIPHINSSNPELNRTVRQKATIELGIRRSPLQFNSKGIGINYYILSTS